MIRIKEGMLSLKTDTLAQHKCASPAEKHSAWQISSIEKCMALFERILVILL